MKTILEPNSEIQHRSAVTALQIAYNEYRHAVNNYFKWTGFNDNGAFYIFDGHKDRATNVSNCAGNVLRLTAIVGLKNVNRKDE